MCETGNNSPALRQEFIDLNIDEEQEPRSGGQEARAAAHK
jgi:hypothetical protein